MSDVMYKDIISLSFNVFMDDLLYNPDIIDKTKPSTYISGMYEDANLNIISNILAFFQLCKLPATHVSWSFLFASFVNPNP